MGSSLRVNPYALTVGAFAVPGAYGFFMCYSPQALTELGDIARADKGIANQIFEVAENWLPEQVDINDPDDGLANSYRVRCAITPKHRKRLKPGDQSGAHRYYIVYRPTKKGDVDHAGNECRDRFVKIRILHEDEFLDEFAEIEGLYIPG
ncbi:hypothetical protein GCM10010103_64880 [Streptomyces paradoxus]